MTSQPSRPPSRQRRAPVGVGADGAGDVVQSSIAFGKERCWRSRTGLGAMVGSQSAMSSTVRRPMWVIWHMIRQSWRCTASASSRK